MGNSDDWLLRDETDSVEPTTMVQREMRAWTLSELSQDDLDFLRSYRPTVELELGEKKLLCFHGSPTSYDDILLPDTSQEQWDRLLGPFAPAIMCGGHTHTQQLRPIGYGLFFNPGSVGFAYDYLPPKDSSRTQPWAEYAILTVEQQRWGIEFRRAPYDVENLIHAIHTSGRPHAEQMIADYRGRS